jgi:hypothetical protein
VADDTKPKAKKEKKEDAERTEITAASDLCDRIMALAEVKGWNFVNEIAAVVVRHE